ncbi:MAG: Co2+/Mg2+ efflux protein ApaG [Xanthobacteraceae bacterium]|nr:Co2+/Mg2+ efflux protein ApaG [Xanthobacteraceae bacterium]MBX3522865.1 Co2+/Mg2+ efflux protein ApaG [Xanthobacteraceae bacterium]MCW5673631.1 Co2+/Mg2+ efflux protein ApaG [Xanthobacteraceae bacterium]
MYRATTRQVQITVTPEYSSERSEPDEDEYFWAYTIEILNLGEEAVQLISRHWIITDANGRTEEVKGAGVVGKQPLLRQGERFEYTSGVPLKTPSGLMRGTYQMVTEDGEDFDAEVPAFSLDAPSMKRVVH